MPEFQKWTRQRKDDYRCPVCGEKPGWWDLNVYKFNPFARGPFNGNLITIEDGVMAFDHGIIKSNDPIAPCFNCCSVITEDGKIMRLYGDVLIPITRITTSGASK